MQRTWSGPSHKLELPVEIMANRERGRARVNRLYFGSSAMGTRNHDDGYHPAGNLQAGKNDCQNKPDPCAMHDTAWRFPIADRNIKRDRRGEECYIKYQQRGERHPECD